jgi:hypothetical protein
MTSLSRRLQRLEATATRLDPSKREREFEEFRRTAEEYIRAAREYLGERPESEMTTSCRNDGALMPIISQMLVYRIRCFRHYYQQRMIDADKVETT